MQAVLVENNGNDRIASDTLLIERPETLSILRSKLSLNILKELSKTPACAIDVAKKLRQHEQKVYYHFRKLENAGLIYSVSSERRYGTIAKIFSVVSPVIALKLFEKGTKIKENFATEVSPNVLNFFSPFIEDGRLNAKVIIGDPYPHGKYEEPARETVHLFDFGLMIGNFISNLNFPYYRLDTEVVENNLKDNLILIGNAWTNIIIDKMNNDLPIYFDAEKRCFVSKKSKRTFKEPNVGVIVKTDNPFQEGKKILLISGIRTRGFEACMIAMTQHLDIFTEDEKNGDFIKIVEGIDKDGDKRIDTIRIIE